MWTSLWGLKKSGMNHRQLIVSVDLWGTLFRLTNDFRLRVYGLLSYYSHFSPDVISTVMQAMNKKFDDVCIATGEDIPTELKANRLLGEISSSLTYDEYESALLQLLKKYPPRYVEMDAISMIEEYCTSHSAGFVIASNSDFISPIMARSVLHRFAVTNSQLSTCAFFPSELLYANPSRIFFEKIETLTSGKIILHLGDTPQTDGNIDSRYNPVLLSTSLDNLGKTPYKTIRSLAYINEVTS